MIKIYGIKNCDTMKKAFKWMGDNNITYVFHDYRKDGIDEALVKSFVNELGLDKVLNTRGTTWRKLSDEVKNNLDEGDAIHLLVENEAMIKRPIFDLGERLFIGFSKKDHEELSSIL